MSREKESAERQPLRPLWWSRLIRRFADKLAIPGSVLHNSNSSAAPTIPYIDEARGPDA